MAKHIDTLVIGGGIVGLSLAWELAGCGQSVTVLESQRLSQAASWAGVGILPPVGQQHLNDPLEQLRTLSHGMLIQWAESLQQSTGIDPGYRHCGGIYVATTPGESATLAANRAYWDELGIEVQPLSADQLVADQPALAQLARSGQVRAAVCLPGECQLRTPHYTRALAEACRQRGVVLAEFTEATQLVRTDARIDRVMAKTGDWLHSYVADRYCLTAGPWTSRLLNELGVPNGILPIRGQVMLFRSPTQLLTRIINEGQRYLVPRDDGRVLVGSNEEEVGFECQTNELVLAELQRWAWMVLPDLRSAELEKCWAGLRPGSFDSYPYIGLLPQVRNAYVAAGHYRAGIHLSAGTARVLAELITSGRSSIDLTPFRPGRG